jgi:hypothetical protein
MDMQLVFGLANRQLRGVEERTAPEGVAQDVAKRLVGCSRSVSRVHS